MNDICGSGASYNDPACDTCLTNNCCPSFNACLANTTCYDCLTGAQTGTVCDNNTQFANFADCYSNYCGTACSGTGTDVCGSGLTYNDATCDTCLTTSCCSSFNACIANTTCYDCITGVQTGTVCDTNALYTSYTACFGGTCGTACTGSDVCGSGLTYSDQVCDDCLTTYCCTSFNPCVADPTCYDCLTGAQSGAVCTTNSLFTSFDGCFSTSCATQCN